MIIQLSNNAIEVIPSVKQQAPTTKKDDDQPKFKPIQDLELLHQCIGQFSPQML